MNCPSLPTAQKLIPCLLGLTTISGITLIADVPAEAATLKALSQGNVANVFTECINDGVGIIVGDGEDDFFDYPWQYAIDSPNDGVDNFDVGGNVYEIYTLALRETEDDIWVAINANLPLSGTDSDGAEDGNIGWGDLFFNFTDKDFTTASNEGNLFGVKFAPSNDSFVDQVGLYSNVTATSTTDINDGFAGIVAYNERVRQYGCQGPGCGPSLGDLPADTLYFDQNQSLNTIASGNFVTGLTYLNNQELQASGYDFGEGEHTIAFRFNKSGICDKGYCEEVPEEDKETAPEPSGLLGLVAVSLALFSKKKLLSRGKN
ncbi:MAG: XDD3 family exosortase-dependent surface protein [Spirulinaceae cyanobacterium]